MNEQELSDYLLYKHYAQEFHREIVKVLGQGAQPYIEGHGYSSELVELIAAYEKFEKTRSSKFQQQVIDVWKHELETHPKCAWEPCEENRIMYSIFCEAHTKEFRDMCGT